MVFHGHCRSRQVGDPVRRSRHLRTEQSRTLNGTSSCNCPLASPGGKLLSVARLMRGGDRLVNECSWMDGICFGFHHSTYCCGDFKRSPPLISHDKISVPRCRYFIVTASPRGKPRTLKILVCTIQRAAPLRKLRTANLATRCGEAAPGQYKTSGETGKFYEFVNNFVFRFQPLDFFRNQGIVWLKEVSTHTARVLTTKGRIDYDPTEFYAEIPGSHSGCAKPGDSE